MRPLLVRLKRLPLVLIAALAAVAAAAAPTKPSDAPIQDWSNVETVVVTAPQPGPAFWHIASGKADIWILATVNPTPKNLQWDHARLEFLLKGANALLLPPTASIGLAEGLWFYMWHMDTLEQPDGTTLESTLPEPLKGRFIAARRRAQQDADRYDKYLAAVAALMLENDYMKAAELSPRDLQRSIEALASRAGVQARAVASYPAMDVVHDVPKLSPAQNRACLDYALRDIDTFSAHAQAAANAWAIGDMDGVKAHYAETRLDACLAQSGVYLALRERAIRDEVTAITAALNKPGKTIVAIPMGFFLRKGGVLERLEAAGLTVSGPGS